MKDLRHLNLSSENIPENKTQLVSQISKHQSMNLLTLPSLDPLQGLVKLELVGTSLTSLPSTSSLVNLRILDCARNCVSSLPSLPPSLVLLNVSHNSLYVLPSLSNLVMFNITKLDKEGSMFNS